MPLALAQRWISATSGFAHLAEGRRRGDGKATLPMQKPAHLANGLQFLDVRLQEDAIDRATGQRDVVNAPAWHNQPWCSPRGVEPPKLHNQGGPAHAVPFLRLVRDRRCCAKRPSCGGSPRERRRARSDWRRGARRAPPTNHGSCDRPKYASFTPSASAFRFTCREKPPAALVRRPSVPGPPCSPYAQVGGRVGAGRLRGCVRRNTSGRGPRSLLGA